MGRNKLVVREVRDSEFGRSLEIIRCAFQTVAEDFHLTEENCPAHPAFMTMEQFRDMKRRGLKLFGLFVDDAQVGFVAVEPNASGEYWLEKLAVLPSCRHGGYGRKLVQQALDYARGQGAAAVSLGMMDEHTVLKKWYQRLGFAEKSTRKFPDLPFTICYMEKKLGR